MVRGPRVPLAWGWGTEVPGQGYLVLLGVMLQVRGLWPPEPATPPHNLKSWAGGTGCLSCPGRPVWGEWAAWSVSTLFHSQGTLGPYARGGGRLTVYDGVPGTFLRQFGLSQLFLVSFSFWGSWLVGLRHLS